MSNATVTQKRRQATDPRAVYTTGQVAKICRVAPRTVSKWIDRGQLVGYRIPGANGEGDRRITRVELIRFMTNLNIPLGPLLAAETFAVLVVGAGASFTAKLGEYMPAGVAFSVASDVIDAGFRVGAGGIDAIILDFADGRSMAGHLAARCQEHGVRLVVGLVGDDTDTSVGITCFDMLVRQDSDPRELADRIAVAFDEKKEG